MPISPTRTTSRCEMGEELPVPIVVEGERLSIGDDQSVSFVCVLRRTTAALRAITGSLLAVGSLAWEAGVGEDSDDAGIVVGLYVAPDWRRRGIGRLLWQVATELSAANGWTEPRHSPHRTEAGDGFARAVGGVVPPLDAHGFADVRDSGF